MQLTPQITYQGLAPSESIDAALQQHVENLVRFCKRIMDCRVRVETEPSHRCHNGNLYHIRVDLTVPGGELMVKRVPPEHQNHDDIYTALRDAFDVTERELKGYAQRQRNGAELHATQPIGQIMSLFKEKGYGTLEAADGHQIVFYRDDVLDADFDRLEEGRLVQFTEAQSDRGLRAVTVRPIGELNVSGRSYARIV